MRTTTNMVRAARAMLRWSQTDLGKRANVSLPTIKRLEVEHDDLPSTPSAAKVLTALHAAGVVFFEHTDGDRTGPCVWFPGAAAPSTDPLIALRRLVSAAESMNLPADHLFAVEAAKARATIAAAEANSAEVSL